MNLDLLRVEYRSKKLDKDSLHQDPFQQFQRWLDEAVNAKIIEPNAMSLATATQGGKPSCRMVILKGFDVRGFMFFTNLESRKSVELMENPKASGVFWWRELERQIILEGPVEKVSPTEAFNYFSRRPRGSQLSSWTSRQDIPVASREVLEKNYQTMQERFQGQEIPLPPYWGGFRIIPVRFEFWQGRADRLHDRFQYLLQDGKWVIARLSP